MPKVFIASPTPIARRKKIRIISYKEPLAIRSKPTLLLQRQRQRLSNSRHGRAVLTPSHPSALVTDLVTPHSVPQSDVPFTKTSALAEHTNIFRADSDANPFRWSPTVLSKQSPAYISFQLSSRKTSAQKEDQRNLQLFPSGLDKFYSKPCCNEVIYHQQPQIRSDSPALREWIACLILGFTLRSDQRHQPPLPVSSEAVAAVATNIMPLFQTYPPFQDDFGFLALWYASHMMPLGLLDQFHLYQPDGILLATRLFVLCYTLAIKWLVDEGCSLLIWAPHYRQGFSLSSANALDKAALELLDYSLYISPSQWAAWLHHLDEWPSANMFAEDRIHLVAQAKIRESLFKLETSSSPSLLSRSISTSGTSVWKLHKILLENLGTQAPSPWNFGNSCSVPPQVHVPPVVVYNSEGEVRPEFLSSMW
ncbi:hypothetical protein BYT27DRAFT_7259812 [Phlegmacium glaucopus]|nr:hypothetical protein BYT27DRAFT_7259812 [Phlegmacium glaucopus]